MSSVSAMRNTATHNLPLGQSLQLQDMNLTHVRKVGKKTRVEFLRVKISITVAFSGRIPVIWVQPPSRG